MIDITSTSLIKIGGRTACAYTFNEINANGDLIRSNVREDFTIVDETLQSHINEIEKFILARKSAT